jgi:hypothetical protein
MKVGMLFTSISFVIAAILELFINENTSPSIAWQVDFPPKIDCNGYLGYSDFCFDGFRGSCIYFGN